MNKPIETVQGNSINNSFTWVETEPMVEIQGPSRAGLRASNRGGHVTLSGSLSSPGKHEITIVQTRTVKVTINVSPKKPVLQTSILNLLTGKNEPLDPKPSP